MDIGIDLGTSSVLVYVKNKGIVLCEPSVVAIDKISGKLLRVGAQAQELLGRTPGNIQAVRPLKDGVISQYEITFRMLQHFLKKAGAGQLVKPRVIVCVPSGITEVEERAVYDASIQAGAKRVYLIEEPIAAALGSGLDISKPSGNMVIDIGGGTTDIAILSMGGVVASESVKMGGDKFDEAIIKYVKKKYNLLIGERTAEQIKKSIGCVWTKEEDEEIEVKGRCLIEGLPKTTTLNSQEILEALEEPMTAIIEAICDVLERIPPELMMDVSKNGILITGGGALLYGIDKIITNVTGVEARIAEDPILCVAKGTGKALESINMIPEGVVNISRSRLNRY